MRDVRGGGEGERSRSGLVLLLLAVCAGAAHPACALGVVVGAPGDGARGDVAPDAGSTAPPDATSPPLDVAPLDTPGPSVDTGPPPPMDVASPPVDTAPPPPVDAGLPPGTCLAARDCAATPDRPVCDTAARRCVRCLVSGDCPMGMMCAAQTCVPMCECAAGEARACTTACGTAGTQRCGADCRWGAAACAPPAETCNLRDDDCNGRCDDASGCRVAVHRSSHPVTGEHFYTVSASEAMCCGFTLEFASYYHLYSAMQPGTVAFYRCYLTAVGMHFYTTSATCEGAVGVNEGVLGYIATSPACGSTPLYRLVHRTNGDHLYTTSATERDGAVAGGAYIDEGVAGHVWAASGG